ncbi:hypothetical protein SRHO_G00082660 [Serrasalmus rhombeus]
MQGIANKSHRWEFKKQILPYFVDFGHAENFRLWSERQRLESLDINSGQEEDLARHSRSHLGSDSARLRE